jgi:glyoxylase-like metal-dependent hydrolase (beta-lactamase superfamily II)
MPWTERFAVGSIECQIVPDGVVSYDPADLAASVPVAEITAAVSAGVNNKGELEVPYNCLLIRSGGRIALVDAGLGTESAGQWGEPAGYLMDSLAASGVSADEVDIVIVSHAHLDHIGGLTIADGSERVPVFPRARHYFCAAEWNFWTGGELAHVPEELANGARTHLPPLRAAGLVDLVDEQTEVLPGVLLLPTPGHTAGHMVVALTSDNEGALYLGDAILDEANFAHPDWVSVFEWDPGLAVTARRALIDNAIDENRLLIAFHLAERGFAERVGRTYRLRHVTG